MNLFSCEHCGVVLDKDRFEIVDPDDMTPLEYGLAIEADELIWDGEGYIPTIET